MVSADRPCAFSHAAYLSQLYDASILQRGLGPQEVMTIRMIQLQKEIDLIQCLVDQVCIRIAKERFSCARDSLVRTHVYCTLAALPKKLTLLEILQGDVAESRRVLRSDSLFDCDELRVCGLLRARWTVPVTKK